MKRVVELCVFILITCTTIWAQNPGAKWLEVVKSDSQSIYLDTTNIKHVGNQITIVDLTLFGNSRLIAAYKKEAKSIKSQILFNITSRKYTVLGTLYYDDHLRIIGESSLSGVSLGDEALATPIDSNQVMKALYSKSLELLSIDTTEYKKSVTIDDRIKALIDNIGKTDQQNIEVGNRDKFIDKEKQGSQGENNQNIETAKPSSIASGNPAGESQQSGYNTNSERNIVSTIFTDGSKYCFQVSSWKNKSKAEYEVAKLKREGHNAFWVDTYLPSKGGTWYRVRIGYFDTLGETENYMSKMKQ